MNKFLFFNTFDDFKKDMTSRLVKIPRNIREKHDLFESYYTQLSFPSYFGYNWDALYDCMIDLGSITEDVVMLIHEDVPFANDPINRKKYFELLKDICSNWEKISSRTTLIYFPKNCLNELG
jgi:RNAse (barnase) inhibitor barstar